MDGLVAQLRFWNGGTVNAQSKPALPLSRPVVASGGESDMVSSSSLLNALLPHCFAAAISRITAGSTPSPPAARSCAHRFIANRWSAGLRQFSRIGERARAP